MSGTTSEQYFRERIPSHWIITIYPLSQLYDMYRTDLWSKYSQISDLDSFSDPLSIVESSCYVVMLVYYSDYANLIFLMPTKSSMLLYLRHVRFRKLEPGLGKPPIHRSGTGKFTSNRDACSSVLDNQSWSGRTYSWGAPDIWNTCQEFMKIFEEEESSFPPGNTIDMCVEKPQKALRNFLPIYLTKVWDTYVCIYCLILSYLVGLMVHEGLYYI